MADESSRPVAIKIGNSGRIGNIKIGTAKVVGADFIDNSGEIGSLSVGSLLHANSHEELLGLVVGEVAQHVAVLSSEERAQLDLVKLAAESGDYGRVKGALSWLGPIAQKVATDVAVKGTEMLMKAYGLIP